MLNFMQPDSILASMCGNCGGTCKLTLNRDGVFVCVGCAYSGAALSPRGSEVRPVVCGFTKGSDASACGALVWGLALPAHRALVHDIDGSNRAVIAPKRSRT
jgi:hypothetical protein